MISERTIRAVRFPFSKANAKRRLLRPLEPETEA